MHHCLFAPKTTPHPIFRRLAHPAATVAVLMGFLVSGCTSLHRKAEKFYAGQAFEEAAAIYEQILSSHPGDADAIVGLRRSREKVVDTKLIEVRMSRMADNRQNSLDMLLKLVQQENLWHFYPKGRVAFSQEEETSEALRYVEHQVQSALARKMPLQAAYEIHKYKEIFAGPLNSRVEALTAEVSRSGQATCKSASDKASANLPYYSQFVRKLCAYWGKESPLLVRSQESKLKDLYRGIRVEVAVIGLAAEMQTDLKVGLDEAFRKTAWFDVNGAKTLSIKVTGNYSADRTEEKESRLHAYTIQVPYTAYEAVSKSRDIPYTDYQNDCATDSRGTYSCHNVPVTKYRTEYYTVNEPVTRYQSVPQSQAYVGTKITQRLSLSLQGELLFGFTKKSFRLAEKSVKSGFEHDFNLPNIGLRPERADLPDPLFWLKLQSNNFAITLEDDSNSLWEAYFCKPMGSQASVVAVADRVHRCLRRKPDPVPPFIAHWYENKFGVSVAAADELIGLKDF